MDGLHDFLAMGGYAAFVWPAYGVTLAALALLAWRSVAAMRRAERTARALDDQRSRR